MSIVYCARCCVLVTYHPTTLTNANRQWLYGFVGVFFFLYDRKEDYCSFFKNTLRRSRISLSLSLSLSLSITAPVIGIGESSQVANSFQTISNIYRRFSCLRKIVKRLKREREMHLKRFCSYRTLLVLCQIALANLYIAILCYLHLLTHNGSLQRVK